MGGFNPTLDHLLLVIVLIFGTKNCAILVAIWVKRYAGSKEGMKGERRQSR